MRKASAYNYFIHHEDGNYYGYNFLYRSLIKVPQDVYGEVDDLLSNKEIGENHNSDALQWISALKSCGFLIDNDTSEINIIKHFYYKSLYASDVLHITILPTLQCNLDCPYCFERKTIGFMNQSTEDNLIKWIEQKFGYKRTINVAWFGGEPLLDRNIIKRITKRIKHLCTQNKINYFASITTNGVFLDSDFVNKIPELSLKHIQVTLDGNRYHHDLLRKTPTGEGSFDTIIRNLANFCDDQAAEYLCFDYSS